MPLTVSIAFPVLEIVSVLVDVEPTRTSPKARLPVNEMIRVGEHAFVVNIASDPFVVPPVFVATARKWYSVLHVRPVIVPPAIATAALPDPSACADVALP